MLRRAHLARLCLVFVALLVVNSPARAEPLGDILFSRPTAKGEVPPAYFPHWVHRIKYKCFACHDDLFTMDRGPTPTMAAMTRGAACGACHNGKQAFGLDVCHRCHLGQ